MNKGAEIIGPRHRLYGKPDGNLEIIGRARYDVQVPKGLEEKFFNFMEEFYRKHGGENGLMMVLGYHPSMLAETYAEEGGKPTGFIMRVKPDKLGKKEVKLDDGFDAVEAAVLDVQNSNHNDGCYLVDLEGRLFNGYEIDVSREKVFRAFGSSLTAIRQTLFGDDWIGATRFGSAFKASYLTVGSRIGLIRHNNGYYFIQNKEGKISIPYYMLPPEDKVVDEKCPEPVPKAELNTNKLPLPEGRLEPTKEEPLLVR